MPKQKTVEQAYDQCCANGTYRKINQVNKEKINTLIENADTNINSANILMKALEKDNKEWMNVYKLYYDSLRILGECLLLLDKTECANHQCLFAYLCTKYTHLELSWEFFEQIRTKRNGIEYYGENITYKDWKDIELKIKLYISTLKEEIRNLMDEL